MHIQVRAPNVETRFTNHVNTAKYSVIDYSCVDYILPLALEELTLRYTKPQNKVQRIIAGYGTPMRLTRRKIRGAFPSMARPYRVREPMYRSELAALMTKTRMAALMTWFRTLIPTCKEKYSLNIQKLVGCEQPTRVVATTKGLAAAPTFDLVLATKSDWSVLGTISPMTKTPPT